MSGGAGHVMDSINRGRQNRAIRSSNRKQNHKMRSSKKGQNGAMPSSNSSKFKDFKPAPEVKNRIRERIKSERRKEQIIEGICIVCGLILIIGIILWLN